MKIILLGAPGAGKGTQASKVCEKFNIPHISTGDIFRKNIKEQTELGLLAKSFMDKGQLVPDDVVIAIVKDRLQSDDCKNGYILDGFPRTVNQAEKLAQFADIEKVINLDIDLSLLVARLSGRRVCSKCGESFHISNNCGSICSKCGGNLIHRDDDKEETIRQRLEVYTEQTKPLISFYDKAQKLVNVQANDSVENIFNDICDKLAK